jgi:flagellar biosynthesis regulator FlbT
VTIPEFLDPIDTVSDHVSGGSLYKGLKEIRKLMKLEEELSRIDA